MDLGQSGYTAEFLLVSPEHADLVDIGNFLVRKKKTYKAFRDGVGSIIRQAYDEVIDMPRSRRWSLGQLEKTEKTYIGTKVEIMIRDWFELERGNKLDLLIDGQEVDVKNTIKSGWMIPREAVGEVCLLIKGNESKSLFSVGLIRANDEYLTEGGNQDRKRTINQRAKAERIFWLVHEGALPANFFLDMDTQKRAAIFALNSGAARVRELFLQNQQTIIPRSAIEGVANQKDPLKRVRKNGGARDKLMKEGYLLLSGKYDAEIADQLGSGSLGRDEFMCVSKRKIIQELGRDRADALLASA